MEDVKLTQSHIDKINKGIPFVDAKIYWKEGYGWSSQYWDKLYKEGWRMVPSDEDPSVLVAKDENGKVILSADSDIDIFRLLINFMVGGG